MWVHTASDCDSRVFPSFSERPPSFRSHPPLPENSEKALTIGDWWRGCLRGARFKRCCARFANWALSWIAWESLGSSTNSLTLKHLWKSTRWSSFKDSPKHTLCGVKQNDGTELVQTLETLTRQFKGLNVLIRCLQRVDVFSVNA